MTTRTTVELDRVGPLRRAVMRLGVGSRAA